MLARYDGGPGLIALVAGKDHQTKRHARNARYHFWRVIYDNEPLARRTNPLLSWMESRAYLKVFEIGANLDLVCERMLLGARRP